jgi:ABC-type lipoprotein export system ATPase subunit
VMELLLELAREKHRTLLVVTHDRQLACLGDRQLFIRDGLLVHQPTEPVLTTSSS